MPPPRHWTAVLGKKTEKSMSKIPDSKEVLLNNSCWQIQPISPLPFGVPASDVSRMSGVQNQAHTLSCNLQ